MGSFFNGGSRHKPRYERLPLDTFYPPDSNNSTRLDDFDDDNLLFETNQNGQLLPSVTVRSGYDSDEEIEFYRDNRRSSNRQPERCCAMSRRSLLYLIVFLVVVILFFSAVYFIHPSVSVQTSHTKQSDWSSLTYEYVSEAGLRLYDVNSDGVQDVLVGVSAVTSVDDVDDEQEYCKKKGKKYPCAGGVVALDGRSGSELWTVWMRVEIFALQCGKLDINKDGHMDCIAAGRMGALYAIDPIQGVILWTVDPDVTNPHFNFYQGQVVPDLDQDGVGEFVVTHGGNTMLSEKEMNRAAGRLILLSGRTGKSLGRYLTISDGHETYSSITLYERQNKAIYLLFGSGGETIAGSLWAISLRDLYCYVMSIGPCNADHLRHVKALQIKGYDDPWGSPIRTLPNGATEILRSGSSKGVTVPTELADINNDGVDDLIVLMYNSTLVVLNGINLEVLWSTGQRFAGLETYSNPAPGYFNDDDTLDLMVRLSKGRWPKFTTTHVYILDGTNGKTLWHLETPAALDSPIMASPLTLQSSAHKDAFLFWVQGLQTTLDNSDEFPQMRHKRHGDDEINRQEVCQLNMDMFHANLLIVDRDTALKPLGLATMDAFQYNYTLTEEDRINLDDESHDHPELVPMETRPPDSPSQSALPTTEPVTQEDIARHDLHRQSTTEMGTTLAEPVSTTTVAVTLPQGIDTTTEAVSTPEDIDEPTTYLVNNGTGTTTVAITTTEGSEQTTVNMTQSHTTVEAVTTPKTTTYAVTLPEGQEHTTTSPAVPTTVTIATSEITTITEEPDTSTHTTAASVTTDIQTSTIRETESNSITTTDMPSAPGSTTTETTTNTTAESATPNISSTAHPTTTHATTTTENIVLTTVFNFTTENIEQVNTTSGVDAVVTSLPVKQTTKRPTTGADETSPANTTVEATSKPAVTARNKTTIAPTTKLKESTAMMQPQRTTKVQDNSTRFPPQTSLSTEAPIQKETMQDMTLDTDTTTEPNAPSTPPKDAAEESKREVGAQSSRPRREIPGGNSCTVYVPNLFGTGIIGDLDNDGNLEYVYTETHMAKLQEKGSYLRTKIKLTVHRLDLNSAIKRQDWVQVSKNPVTLSDRIKPETVDGKMWNEHFKFLPAAKQSWNAYMGRDADGKFRKEDR